MNLDFPVSVPSIPADDKAKAPVVAGTRKLADHPPGEWVERMKAKYGPMPVSENARKVLERRYLKKDPARERMESPERMPSRADTPLHSARGGGGDPSPPSPRFGQGIRSTSPQRGSRGAPSPS